MRGIRAAVLVPVLQHAGSNNFTVVPDLKCCLCDHCEKISVWLGERMLFPEGGSAPLPNADLSEDIQRDYEEAHAILAKSPRGAAALLRLAIQKLCVDLGQPGKNINDDIAALVQKGPQVASALLRHPA